MRTLHPRLVPVTATIALALGACGGDDLSTVSVEPPDTSVADGVRAPTPIRVTGDAAGRAVGAATAEVAATDMMIAPTYVVADYVVGPGMPALPTTTTGYVFDVGAEPSAADTTIVASALGLAGEPVRTDDGVSGWWRVGPDDGTAPSLTLWDDAMHSWNYDWGWVGRDEGVACAVAGVPGIEPTTVDDVAPDDAPPPPTDAESSGRREAQPAETEPVELPIETIVPIETCPEPEPPIGLPSEAEAETRVTDVLTAMGVDLATITLEPFVDDWSASVNATETLDGLPARTWGFTFGEHAELQYAWGSAAMPEPVGPYALVDLDTAVARLQDGSFGYGGLGRVATTDRLAVSDETAVSDDVAVAEAPPNAESPEPAVPEPMPVDVPEGEPIEPEEITVTLVDVQPDLWWVWDVDGSAWLVPAYRFIGDDGGRYTVPAVTDDLLIVEAPPVSTPPPVDDTTPIPTPPPVTTSPSNPTNPPTTTAPTGAIPTADEIGPLVGLPLDEFTSAASPYPVRVVEVDGVAQPVTEDFSPSRINVAVVGDGGVQYVVRATTDDGTPLGERDAPGVTVVPIAEVRADVAYYPACGNEVLDLDGTLWYPIDPTSAPDLYDRAVTSVDREVWDVAKTSGFARVAPPGPGDDIGTFVRYADGIARFVSDSGNLDVWLTTTEITYDWVC